MLSSAPSAAKIFIFGLPSAATPHTNPPPRRAYLERNDKTLTTTKMELDLAMILAQEKASLAVLRLHEEEKGVAKLGSIEVRNASVGMM